MDYKALGLSAGLHGVLMAVVLLFYNTRETVLHPLGPLPLTFSIAWQAPEATKPSRLPAASPQPPVLQQHHQQACVNPPIKPPPLTNKASKLQDPRSSAPPPAALARTPPSIEEIPLKDAYMPAPLYPTKALQLGYEGSIHLKAFLKQDGQIDWLEVLEAKAPLMLVNAALKAVKKWQFNQATAQQYPVLIIPVRFKISV